MTTKSASETISENRVASPRRVIIPLTPKTGSQIIPLPETKSSQIEDIGHSLRIGKKQYQCLDGVSNLKICRIPQSDKSVFLFKSKNVTTASSCTPIEDFLLDWEKSGGEGHVIVGNGSFFDASGELNIPMIGMTLLANQKHEGKIMYHQTGVGELSNIWVPFLAPEVGTLFSALEFNKMTNDAKDFEEKMTDLRIGRVLDPTVSLWKGKSFEDIKRFMYLYLYSDNFIEEFYDALIPITSEEKTEDKLMFIWQTKDEQGKIVENKKSLGEFTDQDKYEFFSRGTTAFHRDFSKDNNKVTIHKIRKQMLGAPKFIRDQIKNYYDHVLDEVIRKFIRSVEFYQEEAEKVKSSKDSTGYKLNKAAKLFVKSSAMMVSVLTNIYTIGRLMKILFVYDSNRVVIYDRDDKIEAVYTFLTEYLEVPIRDTIEAPMRRSPKTTEVKNEAQHQPSKMVDVKNETQHDWIDVSNIDIDMLSSFNRGGMTQREIKENNLQKPTASSSIVPLSHDDKMREWQGPGPKPPWWSLVSGEKDEMPPWKITQLRDGHRRDGGYRRGDINRGRYIPRRDIYPSHQHYYPYSPPYGYTNWGPRGPWYGAGPVPWWWFLPFLNLKSTDKLANRHKDCGCDDPSRDYKEGESNKLDYGCRCRRDCPHGRKCPHNTPSSLLHEDYSGNAGKGKISPEPNRTS